MTDEQAEKTETTPMQQTREAVAQMIAGDPEEAVERVIEFADGVAQRLAWIERRYAAAYLRAVVKGATARNSKQAKILPSVIATLTHIAEAIERGEHIPRQLIKRAPNVEAPQEEKPTGPRLILPESKEG